MDFSKITDTLYIGTHPQPEDYAVLRNLGVRLVINMRWERRPEFDPSETPMPTLWLPTFDSPFFPIPIRVLHQGVVAALETIQTGGAIYCHCAAGRHRSVALGSSILIALGHPPLDAMQIIQLNRKVADPHIWYIRRRIHRYARWWSASQAILPAGQD